MGLDAAVERLGKMMVKLIAYHNRNNLNIHPMVISNPIVDNHRSVPSPMVIFTDEEEEECEGDVDEDKGVDSSFDMEEE